MKIKKITVRNFRLLRDVTISLEDSTTIIVGRNNSGKTSLTEIFKRLLSERSIHFSLYDFNVKEIPKFNEALQILIKENDLPKVRSIMPNIEIGIYVEYDPEITELGLLGEFIVDLNPSCNEVFLRLSFEVDSGGIAGFFEGYAGGSDAFKLPNKELNERIQKYYRLQISSVDVNDPDNFKAVDYGKFRQLISAGFINAQRGLDDVTQTEKDVLGKVLSKLFKTADTPAAPEEMKEKSEALKAVVAEIQEKVDRDFNRQVDRLLPALEIFGYPGLSDSQFSTETTIDVGNILDSHTKIRYSHGNDFFLPESYNGLGSRNLIYILFQLFDFYRAWQSGGANNTIHLIFIEEPEAHLHPQMQQVFIKQINKIVDEFSRMTPGGLPWNVQFVVTTHSSHVANEARFETIRYFLTNRNEQIETKVKDLGVEFSGATSTVNKDFLHKYLTLTKCDLYFADKAILIEGATERILMPEFIAKVDALADGAPALASQYISVIEVGGAYMHHFYKFLDFLELRTLVVTDLDAVKKVVKAKKANYESCNVESGSHCSNAGIKNWFEPELVGHLELTVLKAKTHDDKVNGVRRITYQIPEIGKLCCGRSFEDAFMLANPDKFKLKGSDSQMELNAYKLRPENKEKTEFAIKYGVEDKDWRIPRYLAEGLTWLAINPNLPAKDAATTIDEIVKEGANDSEI